MQFRFRRTVQKVYETTVTVFSVRKLDHTVIHVQSTSDHTVNKVTVIAKILSVH